MKDIINFTEYKEENEKFIENSIQTQEASEARFADRLEEQKDNLALKNLILEYQEKNRALETEVYQLGLKLDAGRISRSQWQEDIARLTLTSGIGELRERLDEEFFGIYGSF